MIPIGSAGYVEGLLIIALILLIQYAIHISQKKA